MAWGKDTRAGPTGRQKRWPENGARSTTKGKAFNDSVSRDLEEARRDKGSWTKKVQTVQRTLTTGRPKGREGASKKSRKQRAV